MMTWKHPFSFTHFAFLGQRGAGAPLQQSLRDVMWQQTNPKCSWYEWNQTFNDTRGLTNKNNCIIRVILQQSERLQVEANLQTQQGRWAERMTKLMGSRLYWSLSALIQSLTEGKQNSRKTIRFKKVEKKSESTWYIPINTEYRVTS